VKPRHQVSRAAIELIERFEGYRRKAAQLPDGRWTIGYGHTLTARQGAEVSEDDAEALLLYDLIAVAHAVSELTFTPLTQNQFDALCAFAFSIGLDNFRQSWVLKRINEGALIQAAYGMELWRKADFEGERIVIDALVRRRAAEKTLFLTPPGGAWVAVPSSALPPALDIDGADLTPRQRPAPIATSLEGERVLVLREGEPAPPPVPPEEPAPVAADVDLNPVTVAAEAVTARLATVFKDEPAAPEAPAEAAHAEAPKREADFAPPLEAIAEMTGDEPFVLTSPEPNSESDEEHGDERGDKPAEPAENHDAGPDLFEQPAAANDPQVVEAADDVPPIPERRDRVVIDDTAPFEFVPARVQPLPQRPRDGLLSLVALAVLGLAFFAGGLFWAANARPGAQALLDPRLVGGLACFAGVSFFCIAVYLLLQRLGRAAERADPKPRN
jgi:lysozyme